MNMFRTLGLGLSVAWASFAWAQQPAVVVQLPSYHVFSVATTVVVPTAGSAALGSVAQSAWAASQFGFHPLRSRSLGRNTRYQAAGVRVWVHDLRRMDRQHLRRSGLSQRALTPKVRQPRTPLSDRFVQTMRQDRAYRGSLSQWRQTRLARQDGQ